MIRLNKYLASHGIASRRKCDELIQYGLVKVNGKVITKLGVRINEDQDQIQVQNKTILKNQERFYFVMNKPNLVVTSTKDEKDRNTVVDLIGRDKKVYPVGRLDFDTTGVLLLTNDGELTYRLTHPKFGIEKVYLTELEREVSDKDLKLVERGIVLEEGRTALCRTRKVGARRVEIIIHEGHKHQVKRMFEALGNKVTRLHRTRFGCITDKGLARGAYRMLTRSEVVKLYQLVKLDKMRSHDGN